MRDYTREEKNAAKAKLPKPIFDFLGSQTLTDLYRGIQQKLKLNLRQVMAYTEIVNVTLMGLEDEHALETNLHQWLPELSNADTKELAADIDDRIFKEARRRLQLNITEQGPLWDEEELGPRETFDVKHSTTDAELDKLAENEAREGWTPPVNPNEGPEEVPKGTEEDEDEGIQEPSGGNLGVVIPPRGASVFDERLTTPTIAKTEEVKVRPESRDIREIEIPATPKSELSTPSAAALSGAAAPGAEPRPEPPKTYPDRVDPYREPIE